MIDKKKLMAAFRAMRAAGLLARQNFLCCQTCGWQGLIPEMEKQQQKGKLVHGGVFYHKQDAEMLRDGKDVCLAFGAMGLESPMRTVDIGKLIVDILHQHGLATEWDGSDTTRIKILANPGVRLARLAGMVDDAPMWAVADKLAEMGLEDEAEARALV